MKLILVVEDDDDVRDTVELALQAHGYAVETAISVTGAVAQLAARRYDLVLSDDRLIDGRGAEVADRALAVGVPALIMSGYMLQASPEALARHEYLMKPLRVAEVLAAVEGKIGPAMAE
jgi:DNA-binding NtrC family response regulator